MTAHRPVTAQERAAYRRYIRKHHPDVGGDPAAFATGLAELRAAFPGPPVPHALVPHVPDPRDRYDAPVVFVPGTGRMRRRIDRLWRRVHPRPGPPRVR